MPLTLTNSASSTSISLNVGQFDVATAATSAINSASAAAASAAAAAQSATDAAASAGAVYSSLVAAAAASPSTGLKYITVIDGGVTTRYIRDKSGTLTTADGSKWAKAEVPAGSVVNAIMQSVGETEGADAINYEARRIDITSASLPYVVDARDSSPSVHMISLTTGTVQIDVSTLDLYKPYYFANISQVRNAPATFDCGVARNFQGLLTDPTTTNKRTFDLQPGMSVTLRRIGGSIIQADYEFSDWIGTTDFKVKMQSDGTYDVRYRYNATGSTPISAGAIATATTSTYLDFTNAIVVSCTIGPTSTNATQSSTAPFVEKMGSAGSSGLAAHQFGIRNPGGTSITGPVTVVFANVARV